MFETVSPEVFIRRDRSVFYETLPISLAIHILVVSWMFASAFIHVAFPKDAPHLAFAYQIALDPPPPPPPPPAARTTQTIQPVKATELPPDKVVAPTVIPDTIPIVEAQPVVAASIADLAAPAAGPSNEGGVPGGDPTAGVKGGTVGGEPRGILGGVLLDDGRVHFKRDMPLPMFIEHQEYPEYPESARVKGWEDSVLVHYVIDTKGRVKELVILGHAEHKEFDEAALKAIRDWKFRPLIVDGSATEAVHELTVFFKLR